MRWAIIKADTLIVDNIIIWSGGESLWPDMITVQLDPNEPCSPGWTYDPTPLATPRFLEPIAPLE